MLQKSLKKLLTNTNQEPNTNITNGTLPSKLIDTIQLFNKLYYKNVASSVNFNVVIEP